LQCILSQKGNALSEVYLDDSRIEHVILDCYTSDNGWTDYTGPQVTVNPSLLPQTCFYNYTTMSFNATGVGWTPSGDVTFKFDNSPLPEKATPNEAGEFLYKFDVTTPTVGYHNLTATNSTHTVTYPIYRELKTTPEGTLIAPADITGPNNVPDGKVDVRDISLAAKRFGWTDPNVDSQNSPPPPLTTGYTSNEAFTWTALASALIATPIFRLARSRKRTNN
jgi:hypothetical protein